MQKKVKNKRMTYQVDKNELLKVVAEINSGGLRRPFTQTAVEILRRVMFARKGQEERKLTDKEISDLIARGYKLTG